MSLSQKNYSEIRSIGLATLYFGSWLGILLFIKQLILEEYQIGFNGMSKALIGTLILSKVVLVLEHVSFGEYIRRRPAWVDVVLRTALYASGVFIVMLIEKAIEGRHEYGGLGPSLNMVFQHADEALNLEATVRETFSGLPTAGKLSGELLKEHLGELFDRVSVMVKKSVAS